MKRDFKNATGVDTSSFARKTQLPNLKSIYINIDKLKNVPTNLNNLESKVDNLDVHKIVPAPVDISKVSDLVKNVVKKDVYNVKIKKIEDKIPGNTNLAINASVIAKMRLKEKYLVTNLATTAAFKTLQNKIPNVSHLVKKAD